MFIWLNVLFSLFLFFNFTVLGFTAKKDFLWQPGQRLVVHVVDANVDELIFIEHEAQKWLQHSSLKAEFYMGWPKANETSHIRILLGGLRNSSAIGTQALQELLNQPTMELAALRYPWVPEKEKTRLVLHEFGHALGLVHEHTHLFFPHSWSLIGVQSWCKKKGASQLKKCTQNFVKSHLKKEVVTSPYYDELSILNYKITPSMTHSHVLIPKTYTLSDWDKEAMRHLYP